MKKVLIVNKSFETGGIQSSMINMVNELINHCQVDLFIYNPQGPMMERLDKRIRVLSTSWRFQAIGMTLKQAIQSKDLRIIAYRIFASLWTKIIDNKLPIYLAIKHHKHMHGYDVAIAFHQEQRKKSVVSGFTRVVNQLTDAKTKLAWIHFDSSTIDLDRSFNEPFYRKMDKIVCVSQSLMQSFAQANPSLSTKVDYCYNFIEYDKLFTQSQIKQEVAYPKEKFICFSACRLAEEKALVRAINVLAEVFHETPDLMWYIAGDGVERKNIEDAISDTKLGDQIILLGNQKNPYPYMKNADLIMNVSYHEAAPMVFFEAKALGVPVFATKTASAMELLNHEIDAFVCENTSEGIYKGFAKLMENRSCVVMAKQHLQNIRTNNELSLQKVLSFG